MKYLIFFKSPIALPYILKEENNDIAEDNHSIPHFDPRPIDDGDEYERDRCPFINYSDDDIDSYISYHQYLDSSSTSVMTIPDPSTFNSSYIH